MYRLGRFLAFLWLRCCYRLAAIGAENVPPAGGALIASNHVSFLDPMAIGCSLRRTVTFLARGTLSRSRLFRVLTLPFHLLLIDRERSDVGALRFMAEALRAGTLLVAFPEGTRSADGRIASLKGGIVLAARQAGVPVVPAFVEGSFHIWPRQRRLPRPFGRLRVWYGKPISVENGSRADQLDRLRQALEQLQAAARGAPDLRSAGSAEAMKQEPGAAQGCGPAALEASVVDVPAHR